MNNMNKADTTQTFAGELDQNRLQAPLAREMTDEQIEAAACNMISGEIRSCKTTGNMTGTVCCTR